MFISSLSWNTLTCSVALAHSLLTSCKGWLWFMIIIIYNICVTCCFILWLDYLQTTLGKPYLAVSFKWIIFKRNMKKKPVRSMMTNKQLESLISLSWSYLAVTPNVVFTVEYRNNTTTDSGSIIWRLGIFLRLKIELFQQSGHFQQFQILDKFLNFLLKKWKKSQFWA